MVRDDLAFIINPTSQTVAANNNVIFTTMARKANCAIRLQDNNIILRKPGYYVLSGTITFTGAAGAASIQLVKNEVNVTAATSSTTIGTANTEINTLPITAIVRVLNGEVGILALRNTGVQLSISNAQLSIEYKGNVCTRD